MKKRLLALVLAGAFTLTAVSYTHLDVYKRQLFVVLVVTSILTINRVEYVDENGNHSVGITASRNLREAKNKWAGYLTEDTLRKVLEENTAINNSKEALSDDIVEQDKACLLYTS